MEEVVDPKVAVAMVVEKTVGTKVAGNYQVSVSGQGV